MAELAGDLLKFGYSDIQALTNVLDANTDALFDEVAQGGKGGIYFSAVGAARVSVAAGNHSYRDYLNETAVSASDDEIYDEDVNDE